MTKLDSVERRLRRAIEARLEAGWVLVTGAIGNKEMRHCCALGSVTHGRGLIADAAKALGVDRDTALAIAIGFDGRTWGQAEFCDLGRRLRADYYETSWR